MCSIQQLEHLPQAGEGDVTGFVDDVAVRVDIERKVGVDGDGFGKGVLCALNGKVRALFCLGQGG